MFRVFLHFAKAWAGTVNPAWEVQMGKYQEIDWECIDNPEFFLDKAAADTIWLRLFDKILNCSSPPLYRWFASVKLIAYYPIVARHVKNNRGKQVVFLHPKSSHGVLGEFRSSAGVTRSTTNEEEP
jgi:hypothetical protein